MAYITGNNFSNTLFGTDGADLIYGYNGSDTIYGGASVDYINGGRGDDRLFGEGGDDVFEIGGNGSDTGLSPAGGLNGGWDSFDGGSGYDTIRIWPTAFYEWTAIMVNSIVNVEALDNASGGPGYVYFRGAVDFSGITSMTNIDEFRGDSSSNTFLGSELDERVYGFAGNDVLRGNGGGDRLFGGDGNDTLDGGTGFNLLWGEAGADTFHFSSSGRNFVMDFSSLEGDVFKISTDIAPDFAALKIFDDGGMASIQANGLDILLFRVPSSSLSESDFVFV
jgi:Ca2+-binding RTX toxin-like protein